MGIPIRVGNDIPLLPYPSKRWVLYPPKCSRILNVTNIHTWVGSLPELPLALGFRDLSAGLAAETPTVMERSFVRDCIAILALSELAKYIRHLVWSGMWCDISVLVISSR